MSTPVEYASFLIRLWRERGLPRREPVGDWCIEVEHVQSGRKWSFDTLEELLGFLSCSVEQSEIVRLLEDQS